MSRLLRLCVAPAQFPPRPASLKARLLLLALERRIAPATFTVTNTGDTGAGSGTAGDLRYCINRSNVTAGPNTIDATGVTGMITLTSALPTVSSGHDLTITGPGANLLNVSGANSYRIFTDYTTNFTLNSLTLSGGRTQGDGGAIDQAAANENLTVANCVISGCTSSFSSGGAISNNYVGSSTTITDSIIQNNSASRAGGAIYDYPGGPVVTISGSIIQK